VIKNDIGNGFVILSSKGNSKSKILAFSKDGFWDEELMPALVNKWLGRLDKIGEDSLIFTNRTNNYLNNKRSITPLLTCHWHQSSPYNDLSPIISDGNVKTAAGCVAVAAAQIAYYWRKDNPIYTLRDTPVYPYGSAPVTYSVPKGSLNNWELMKDSYTANDSQESRYAAAQLCYVIGTTSYLNYASSTGGSINDASNALYSQFDLTSEYTAKSKLSQQEWEELLYNQIEKGYPVLCAGAERDGHAFVLDGYDNESNLYHFNFGWGGAGDGYYPVDDSELSMGGYYNNQSVVYNILPKNRNISASMNAEGINGSEPISISVSITNNSTLDLRGLNVYFVQKDNTIQDVSNPIWQYDNIIRCDGITQQLQIKDLILNSSGTIYLTDENKCVLCELHIHDESGINSIAGNIEQQCSIYDLRGNKVETPTKGLYLIKKEGRTIKIIK